MATGRAGTVAIWSLCVSKGDLVTVVLDIENVGDQIDLLRRHPLDTGGLGPRFETAAAPIPSTARTRRRGLPAPAQEPADVTSSRPDPIQDPRVQHDGPKNGRNPAWGKQGFST